MTNFPNLPSWLEAASVWDKTPTSNVANTGEWSLEQILSVQPIKGHYDVSIR